MPKYDLAGNPLPERSESPPPSATPPPPPGTVFRAAPPPPAYQSGTAPAYTPRQPVTAPVPVRPPSPGPASPHTILTRGIIQETPAQKVRAYAGLLGTFLLLIALTYAVAAIPPPRIPPPTSYTKHTVERAGFTYDAPDGWERNRMDVGFLTQVVYKNRKAMVEINYVPQDAMPTGTQPDPNAAHAKGLELLTDELDGVAIHDQPAQPLTTGLGDTPFSEWTAAAGLTRLHGCRATLAGPGLEAFVICFCPERDWKALQPAFLHIIQSAAPIGGAPLPGAPAAAPTGAPNGGM